MWIPAIKVGDKKWIIFTAKNREKFNKIMEDAVLCDETIRPDGTSSLRFCTQNREVNSKLIEPLTRWFGVATELTEQYEETKAIIEEEQRAVISGVQGLVRGGNNRGSGGGEVSH